MSFNDILSEAEKNKVTFLPPIQTRGESGEYIKVSKIGTEYDSPLKMRILGSAADGAFIGGFRAFAMHGKAIRATTIQEIEDGPPLGTNQFTGEPEKIVEFHAFPAFVYQTNSVGICEIHQKTIMYGLEKIAKKTGYEDPRLYDVEIKKNGNRYVIEALPPSQLTPEQINIIDKTITDKFDLAQLFKGGNPFGPEPENAEGMNA